MSQYTTETVNKVKLEAKCWLSDFIKAAFSIMLMIPSKRNKYVIQKISS